VVLILRDGETIRLATQVLAAYGIEAVIMPLLATEPKLPPDSLLCPDTPYDWAVFTSAAAVRHTMTGLGCDPKAFHRVARHIISVGAKTQNTLQDYGLEPRQMAVGSSDQEGIVRALRGEALAGARVVWFTGDRNRLWLAEQLTIEGAVVTMVPVYVNRAARLSAEMVARLRQKAFDAILYSSGSVVEELVNQLDDGTIEVVRSTRAFSIGPHTSEVLRQHGVWVTAEASTPSWDALAKTVVTYFAQIEG
jgi:uroporphyrinogen III methyltransferase/synthase